MKAVSTIKGVILAGGNGTRLMPMTKAVNKHLLPVGQKPMLQHCIEKMTEAGIKDILVVTGGEHLGGIAEFCGSGAGFGCEFTFRVQDAAGGIAQALNLAKGFVRPGEQMCVMLGDNIFESSLSPLVDAYVSSENGAMVVLKHVDDPERFGVPILTKVSEGTNELKITQIEEKPENPATSYAVTGIYFYDEGVFDIINGLTPSDRGELEITDVNNVYIGRNDLGHVVMEGWWTDAGTLESLEKANELVRQ